MGNNKNKKVNVEQKKTVTPKVVTPVKEEVTETITPEVVSEIAGVANVVKEGKEVKDTKVSKPVSKGLSPEVIANTPKIIADSTRLCPDSKVALAVLANERYIKNPEASIKYGKAIIDEIDGAIDVLVIMSLLDLREECKERGVDLNLTLQNGKTALQFEEACRMFGITTSAPKQLADGQQVLKFTDAKVDKNIEEVVVKERAKAKEYIENKIPELDPTRMTTPKDLEAALQYKLTASAHPIKNVIFAIEFYKNYLKVKTTDKAELAKIEGRDVGEWIGEIMKVVKPTLLLTGMGRTVYGNTIIDKNPIAAHCLIRKSLLDDTGKCIYTNSEVASIVIALLKANAMFNLKDEPVELRDQKIANDKALAVLLSGNEALIESIVARTEPVDKKIFSLVQKQYFPNLSLGDKDLNSKMHRRIGAILNLYLPATEQMEVYSTVGEEEEFPITEEVTTKKTVVKEEEEEKKNKPV